MKGPLESTKYLILVAVAKEPSHGADIREQIIGDTVGLYIGDGTLYSSLKSLLRDGLIEEVGRAGEYRRVYRLSEKGARLVANEVKTQARVVRLASERLRLGRLI